MELLKATDIKNLDENKAEYLLKECDIQINGLRNMLELACCYRRLLEEQLRSLRYQRSSLNRVPDELVLEIFRFVTCEDSLALGPLLLVKRRWHRLIVGSPCLWVNIEVHFQAVSYATDIKRATNYVKLATQLNNVLPIDVNLTLPTQERLIYETGLHTYKESMNALRQFMRTIAGTFGANVRRLRSFRLDYNPNKSNDLMLHELFHYSTPRLEELQIRIPDTIGCLSRQIFRHSSPKLSRISVDAQYCIDNLLWNNAALDSLHLIFSSFRSDPLPIRSLLSNLRYLCLDFYEHALGPTTQTPEVLLPSLQDLTICGWHRPHYLRAPKLATLRIFEYNQFDAARLPYLPQFPSLRKLHLHWPIGDGIIERLQDYLDQHLLVEEVGIVFEGLVNMVGPPLRTALGSRKVLIRGYRASPEELRSWSAPFLYEANGMEIE